MSVRHRWRDLLPMRLWTSQRWTSLQHWTWSQWLRATLGCALLLIQAPVLAQAPDVIQSSTESERAELSEQLLQEGREAFESKRYRQAHESLSRAYRTHQSYRTACALGQVELELELHRDAAEHLDICISRYPEHDPQQARERVLEGLRETRLHVSVFEPHVNVRGATILVNGVEVATTPLTSDLFVEPGLRRVTVRRAGYVDASAELLFTAGGTTQWQAVLMPTVAEQKASKGHSYRNVSLGVGTALTAVTVLGGAALTIIAQSEQARADRSWSRATATGTCTSASRDETCLAARDQRRAAAEATDLAAVVLWTGAGLGVLTVAAYLLLPDEGARSSSSAASPLGLHAWSASVHPRGAEAGWRLNF